MSRRIDDAERRARLGIRHHLAPRPSFAPSPAAVARAADPAAEAPAVAPACLAADLVGLHATDPASVYLEAWARIAGFERTDLDRALYEDRSVVRMIAMRRTLFVLPVELVPIADAACTRAIAGRERRRLVGWLTEAGIGGADPGRWLRRVERDTLAALEARGEAAANELTPAVPELRERISFGEGKRWAGSFGVSTRVLMLLAMEGRIVRARPRGSWVSGQYRYAPADRWLPADRPRPSTEEAQSELVRRWLGSFGPGTEADLAWWSGLTLREIRRALASLPVTEVELEDGSRGLVLSDDLHPVDPPEPWVALVPGLDATTMGWTRRSWYLGPHGGRLFDTNGNAGPTIWVDGRIVGGWGQRPDGEVVVHILEDIGRDARSAIEARAAQLTAWVDGLRVTPRFRTPLEVELGG